MWKIEGIVALHVIIMSSWCKLAALIRYFKSIRILSTPPTSVSTTIKPLERKNGTRVLLYVNITVNIKKLEHP